MINKKMILSVLIIAFIGIGAAGTWANYAISSAQAGTVTTGTVTMSLTPSGTSSFSVANAIPGTTLAPIYLTSNSPQSTPVKYTTVITNTGNIPAYLFISSAQGATGAAGGATGNANVNSHVHVFYATSATGTPTALPTTPTQVGTTPLAASTGSVTLYFWYTYDDANNGNGNQNDEMGATITNTATYELRNPTA